MLIWMKSPEARGRRFVLLDRDGVFNENRVDHVKNIRELIFYPDALEALAILNRMNMSVVIISNQSGINRGLIPWNDFWDMHDVVIRTVEQHGGDILAALYCPHRPDERCECRKPLPAMILTACRIYGIVPGETCFIGDSDTDIGTARAAGCQGVRIGRNLPELDAEKRRSVDTPVFSGLLEAVLTMFK